MAIEHFQHTRSTGKMLTYDIEITLSGYKIRRSGELLCEKSRPLLVDCDVPDDVAAKVVAISDIENLVGMEEE